MSKKRPNHIEGKLGYYALAAETSISRGTWEASYYSAQIGLTAAERVRKRARFAFALCRPLGHHATADMYGGYCFLNNAAIAAKNLRDTRAARVAILDLGSHHRNGTQDIFYNYDDVLFVSLHGDPMDAFPYYLGHAEETGNGAGQGYNLNFPMTPKTGFEDWRKALLQGLEKIADFTLETLIISLGVDTFENDPISFFNLNDDYLMLGADIAAAGLPTLFVMEGGYYIEEFGVNTVNTLIGFENAV